MDSLSIVNSSYKSHSVHRRDLADYFPTTAKFYPGYVKMAVFREKLKTLIASASITDDYRQLLLAGVDTIDWRPEDLTARLQAELRKQARDYAGAAVLDPAVQIVGGKAVKKVSKYAKAGLTKVSANPKVNAKVGKAINALTKEYEYGEMKFGKIKVGAKTFEPKMNMAEADFVEYGVEKAGDGVGGWASKKTGWKLPEGVDLGMNNETTRSWMTRFGVSEGVASFTWGAIDILSDFCPPASLTKSVESFLANSYLAYRYWSDARKMEETKKFFDQKWKEITKKLKDYIKTDLNSLSDKEFTELSNMLFR